VSQVLAATLGLFPFFALCRAFRSEPPRTRTCDLLIRSHSPSETRADTEGQGETKQRFYRKLTLLKGHRGTGRDTRLRSDCGQNLCSETQSPWSIERVPEREGLGIRSRPCCHIAKHSPRLQDSDSAKYLCLLIRRRVPPGV
jgi:hypothetical protein